MTVTRSFPPFDLARLLKTVFHPKAGERVAILIDLDDPAAMAGHAYLKDSSLSVQRHAHAVFYKGLKQGGAAVLGLQGGDMFAYAKTGGSNLDLPDAAVNEHGDTVSLSRDVYPNYDIILCVSTYSATAPLTAFSKEYGFRGATLHGLNPIILESGLSVDYDEVSAEAEKMRLGMTKADAVEIDFVVGTRAATLRVELGRQEAQKSHGLCRTAPDIANLPAGEVYFVPEGAEGSFPHKYEDGTLAMMHVSGGGIKDIELLSGDHAVVDAHKAKIAFDPKAADLGELGFGTQVLPVSGRDIQDEKIRGTFHLATGRSDHLGGNITPDLFKNPLNASHDDILFSPTKTPEIQAPQVRLYRNGETIVLLENYREGPYLQKLLGV
ncbi:MAG: hypothetical protein HYV27_14585 [Candidatus Hydrogenedentes bacterium]|nr:hypothetical protein [Candidatus Hydrogenedentota bacterium]